MIERALCFCSQIIKHASLWCFIFLLGQHIDPLWDIITTAAGMKALFDIIPYLASKQNFWDYTPCLASIKKPFWDFTPLLAAIKTPLGYHSPLGRNSSLIGNLFLLLKERRGRGQGRAGTETSKATAGETGRQSPRHQKTRAKQLLPKISIVGA